MMGSPQNLSFLRPYTTCPLKVGIPAYARFYSLTRSHHYSDGNHPTISRVPNVLPSGTGRPPRPHKFTRVYIEGPGAKPTPTVTFDHVPGSDTQSEPEGDPISHFENLGAGIKDRIRKLCAAGALKYPRMQPPVPGRPHQRIPAFIQRHKGIKRPGSVTSQSEIVLSGRVSSVRRSGNKLAFIEIRQDNQTVQLVLNWAAALATRSKTMSEEEHFKKFKHVVGLIRRGDIISVPGVPNRDNRGAVGLAATDLPTILCPAIADLPESLTEVRHGNRHIDLLVNPSSSGTMLLRSHLLNILRSIFASQQFLEVTTPILASNASGASANPFKTYLRDDELGRPLSLRIAPELWLKRLVIGGFDRVYEIGPAFRNEGQDLSHNPEFTMCEFYQSYATLNDLMAWTCKTLFDIARGLTTALAPYPHINMPSRKVIKAFAEGQVNNSYQQVQYFPTLEKKLKLSFKTLELHRPGARQRLLEALVTNELLARESEKLKSAKDMTKIFDILSEKFLESMYPGVPYFITHQPAFMSPLSKWTICPETKMPVAARAELFFSGMEIANMYEEENSPFEQRLKLLAQLSSGDDLSAWDAGNQTTDLDGGMPRNTWPSNDSSKSPFGVMTGGLNTGGEKEREGTEFADEQYVEALLSGMPPTAGWGCGIDRLVMLFSDQSSISNTLSFGSVRHVRAFSERSRMLASGGGGKRLKGEEEDSV